MNQRTYIDPTRRRSRVLITGVFYRPEVTGIAPYTTALAEHLVTDGFDVVVLTAMPSYPAWRVFEGYEGSMRRRSQEGGVDVHRFRTYVPSQQSALRRGGYELSFLLHGMTHSPLRRAPDVVLGVIPSLCGGVLARVEAARYRCPYGLMIQDLTGPAATQSGISGGSKVAAITGAMEGRLARAATRLGVISETFRPYLERAGVDPKRIVHLPNWAHIGHPTMSVAETRARLGWPRTSQIVLHTGNMGLKQGLEHLLIAARLAATEHPKARFVLMGDGNQRRGLETLASDLTNLEFADFVDEAMYPNVLAAADILMINERASVLDMSLPSKMTSYFVAGRPVVAAVPLNGGTARELARAGAGLVVPAEDPRALVAALRELDGDPERASRLGSAGVSFAEAKLSRKVCLARVEAFLMDILNERRVEVG